MGRSSAWQEMHGGGANSSVGTETRSYWLISSLTKKQRGKGVRPCYRTNGSAASNPLLEARLHLPNGLQSPRIVLPAGHTWLGDISHWNCNSSAQPTCCDLTGTVYLSGCCLSHPRFLQCLSAFQLALLVMCGAGSMGAICC